MPIRNAVFLLVFIFVGCDQSSTAPDSDGTAVTPPVTTAPAGDAAAITPPSDTDAPQAKLNLNTATDEAFLTVPGVGNRMVHEFTEYRPYVSITQFRREMSKYVDAATIAGYEKFVYVPIVPNECDSATLQQIPGIDEATAATLIENRPYASDEAFFEALGTHVDATELAIGRSYLAGS